MYIIDTNIHTQLYSRKLILLLFFSLTGVISLTSPFLQSSLHLTSLQDSLNLFINDIQIIPGLNDLFVKIVNEFRIPFFLIACLLFNIVSFCLINAQPFGFFCFLYFSRWQLDIWESQVLFPALPPPPRQDETTGLGVSWIIYHIYVAPGLILFLLRWQGTINWFGL